MSGEHDHEAIWPQPECMECRNTFPEDVGRLWASNDPWGKCEACGKPPTKYVRADLAQPRVGAAIARQTPHSAVPAAVDHDRKSKRDLLT